jgi:outer membrane protein assembly factor BamD (BamD/ComL family)
MLKKLILLLTITLLVSPVYCLDLERAKTYYLSGDYNASINECEKILSSAGHSPDIDQLYYLAGMSYLKAGNYLRASDIFEIILKEFKGSCLKDEATLGLGDAYFLKGDYEKAGVQYKKIIADPYSKLKPQAYYRMSQVAFKLGNAAEGRVYAQKLKQEYPLNNEIALNQDIGSLGDYYTVQVGAFASFQNANNLTQKLIQKGYPAYIEESAIQGKTTYRVRVGRLSQRQEAVALESSLAQEGYPTKICP